MSMSFLLAGDEGNEGITGMEYGDATESVSEFLQIKLKSSLKDFFYKLGV